MSNNRQPLGEDGAVEICICGHEARQHTPQWAEWQNGQKVLDYMCNAAPCDCMHFAQGAGVHYARRSMADPWSDTDGADTAEHADVWIREWGKAQPA